MRGRRRFRSGGRRPDLKAGAVWAVLFMAIGGGYGVVGPMVDDYRSGLRAMESGCRVERVIDGDTVDLACGPRRVRARIDGYDTPELFSAACAAEQEAGQQARRALATAAGATRRTQVAFLGGDKYGRELVDMRLDGRRVAALMVEAGHGRRYLGGLRGGWCG